METALRSMHISRSCEAYPPAAHVCMSYEPINKTLHINLNDKRGCVSNLESFYNDDSNVPDGRTRSLGMLFTWFETQLGTFAQAQAQCDDTDISGFLPLLLSLNEGGTNHKGCEDLFHISISAIRLRA